MRLDEMLLKNICAQPDFNKRKNRFNLSYTQYNTINSTVITNIQMDLCAIKKYADSHKYENIRVNLSIKTNFFKDKTVVLLLELMLYSLLKGTKISIYINIQVKNMDSILYNFFHFSFLNSINRKRINSNDYCQGMENFHGSGYHLSRDKKELIAINYRKFLCVNDFKNDDGTSQQYLSNDIYDTISHMISDDKIIDDTCSILDELIDNILDHTKCIGLMDMAVIKVKSSADESSYYQVTINVINISENCLFTNIKEKFKNKITELKNYEFLEKAYNSQRSYFDEELYSENLFFMVSAFQNGITTREDKSGGTGLSNSIIKFLKKSQSERYFNLSYVYSGNDIIKFNKDILSKNSSHSLAFNEKNDYNEPPNNKCIGKSDYYLQGTAYNLMFIVKEE